MDGTYNGSSVADPTFYGIDFVQKPTESLHMVGVIFSKDRPMQLDALLCSFALHCQDAQDVKINVLYKASDAFQESLYQELAQDYPRARFVAEKVFKEDLIRLLQGSRYILFLVDDTLFVRSFHIAEIISHLRETEESLGFSLRLGKNTIYCHHADTGMPLPGFRPVSERIKKYIWSGACWDFGFPLEVSSSVYRADDVLPLLEQLAFSGPNSLEMQLDSQKSKFGHREFLSCYEQSVAFSAPLNKVQTVGECRAGQKEEYSPAFLGRLFREGRRVDVFSYAGSVPNAPHVEVELQFCEKEVRSASTSAIKNLLRSRNHCAIERPLTPVRPPHHSVQIFYSSEGRFNEAESVRVSCPEGRWRRLEFSHCQGQLRLDPVDRHAFVIIAGIFLRTERDKKIFWVARGSQVFDQLKVSDDIQRIPDRRRLYLVCLSMDPQIYFPRFSLQNPNELYKTTVWMRIERSIEDFGRLVLALDRR